MKNLFFLKATDVEVYERVKFVGDRRCCQQVVVPDKAGYKSVKPETEHERSVLKLVDLQFNPEDNPENKIRVQRRSKIHPKIIRFVDRRNEGCFIEFKKVSVDKESTEFEIFENAGYFEHTGNRNILYVPIAATDQNGEEMDINSQDCLSFWKGKCPTEIKLASYSGWYRTQKLVDVEE